MATHWGGDCNEGDIQINETKRPSLELSATLQWATCEASGVAPKASWVLFTLRGLELEHQGWKENRDEPWMVNGSVSKQGEKTMHRAKAIWTPSWL